MGYDIYLRLGDDVVQVPRHMEGGTVRVGGTTEAHISVTYNYVEHFRARVDLNEGIRWLYGKTGVETLGTLLRAVASMQGLQSEDYWEPTEGNARHILWILAGWAMLYPGATWEGD